MAFAVSGLPTESLYKFMSIGGLAIIIATYFGFTITTNELTTDLIKIKSKQNLIEIKIKFISAQISRDSAQIQLNRQRDTSSYSTDLYRLRNNIHVYDRKFISRIKGELIESSRLERINDIMVDSSRQKSYKLSLQVAEIREQTELARFRYDQLVQLIFVSFISMVIGVTSCIVGFRKWYEVQKDLDKAIKKAAQ